MKQDFEEFYTRAAMLGHDTESLARGKEQTRYFRFGSILECRKLLSTATPQQRSIRQQTFFNPPVAARSRLGQGIHDRGESIVFADGSTQEGDDSGVNRHFPAPIKAVSILEKTIDDGEAWDLTATADQWGVHEKDEIYTALNVGRLVIRGSGKLLMRGNIFSIVCQELIVEKQEGKRHKYQFYILPTPFSVDFKDGPLDGKAGNEGLPGKAGRNGKNAQLENSLLGNILLDPVTSKEMQGTDGTSGEDGANGTPGRNGGMCRITEITIRRLEGEFGVFVQAGKGGDGGSGGNGGDGGDGGSGADAFKSISVKMPHGKNGNGGDGGNGGRGGNGGNGGIASNVYIEVPAEKITSVRCLSLPSEGGQGGRGGKGGTGGRKRGTVKTGEEETLCIPGRDGEKGQDGRNGKPRPSPWVFLNGSVFRGEGQT